MSKLFKSILSYSLVAILAFSFVALAGTLTPGGNTSTPTMYTLSDIYSKIQDLSYSATSSDHTVSTSSSATSTFSTLEQIYTLIDALNFTAGDIATGTSIMGVAGNISLPPVDKVEDGYFYGANNALEGTMSAGTPALEWSDFISNGSMNWADVAAYCVTIGYTRLPTISELLAGIAGQYMENPPTTSGFTDNNDYWSSSEYDADNVWEAYIENGIVHSGTAVKVGMPYPFRCVR